MSYISLKPTLTNSGEKNVDRWAHKFQWAINITLYFISTAINMTLSTTPPPPTDVGIFVSVMIGTFHSYSAQGGAKVLGSFEVPTDFPPLFSAFRVVLLCLAPLQNTANNFIIKFTLFFLKKKKRAVNSASFAP